MYDVPEIECTKCGWQGLVEELWCHPDDIGKPVEETTFNMCPECEAIDSCIDYED